MADDLRSISGVQKVSILMLALAEEHSTKLFTLLDEEEIKEISLTMAQLGSVSSSVVERLFVDFASQMSTTGSLVGTFQSTERLLLKALPKEQVDDIMEEMRGPAGRTMWEKLANVNETVLAAYLSNEYPQTVAVILSKIRSEHASRVLAEMPEDFALEVMMRMLSMEVVQKEVEDSIEKTLRAEFLVNLSQSSKQDSYELMADIFNSLDRSTEARFMSALEERSRDAAERIRALMFTFEDLAKIDPSGIQVMLRNIEKDKLALALKGGSDTIKDLFFTNMSERAAKILQEDMEAMGPVRLREVDEAQMEMVNIAKDLAAKGEIFIADGGGDEMLV